MMFASIVLPLYYIFKMIFKDKYLTKIPEENLYSESKYLQFFKKTIENKLICAYLWCKSFVLFLQENSGYLWTLAVIWFFNFNLGSLAAVLLYNYGFL